MLEEKERLDSILVKRKMFESRQKAKFAIEEGHIFVNGKVVDKSSRMIGVNDKVEIKGQTLPFVSRGGLKLEKAIRVFELNLAGKVCADIGASTGGFTDCMLQNKTKKVYAIDVGHDQLAEEIKKNKKVINMEGTNIKEIDTSLIEPIDFIGADVSFISITHVLPKIYELLKIRGQAILLIKPQFEAGQANITKTGVVKDSKIHKKIVLNIGLIANKLGFKVRDIDYSPIKGPAGNIEYLLYIEKNENNLFNSFDIKNKIEEVVNLAFKNLK